MPSDGMKLAVAVVTLAALAIIAIAIAIADARAAAATLAADATPGYLILAQFMVTALARLGARSYIVIVTMITIGGLCCHNHA